eukprot:scaffold609_cov170-Amphora_coffeaeformis.AAC.45
MGFIARASPQNVKQEKHAANTSRRWSNLGHVKGCVTWKAIIAQTPHLIRSHEEDTFVGVNFLAYLHTDTYCNYHANRRAICLQSSTIAAGQGSPYPQT